MRCIYRAAMDGESALDDARKAMIVTKTLWRPSARRLRKRQWTNTMHELEPDVADEALTAIAEAALPAEGETVEAWSAREVTSYIGTRLTMFARMLRTAVRKSATVAAG
jgi:hypothetical protein